MIDDGTYHADATPPGSADLAASHPTQTRFVVLAAICGLSLLTYLDRVCIMRASPDIQAELALDDEQMGLVFSAFLVGYALLEVPGGWLGDRWGTRRVLTVIVVWWSAFTALTGFVPGSDTLRPPLIFTWAAPLLAHGFLLLLLVRFLFGAGEAGAYPNLARVVGA
jgi:MFS family permease